MQIYTTPAVVFTGVDQVSIRDIAMPDPAPDEVRIRTISSTISAGTEGWALQNRFTWAETLFPCVPGYQRVGVIEAIGNDVHDWHIGERVMATIGRWHSTGVDAVRPFWGAHVASGNTPAAELYQIPPGVSDTDASGAVVAQVGYNAASRAMFNAGDWVLVYGDGLIGQCAAQAARARGARVILVGHHTQRLALVRQFSADAVINNREAEVVTSVQAHIGNESVTAVLDTVQSEAAEREYVPLLQHGKGQIVYCGFTPGTSWADMALLQQRELTTHFVSGWTRARMEATLALMAANTLCLQPLITHHVSFREAPYMYRMIGEKTVPFLGITLQWT